MMMTRRTLSAALVAGAAASLISTRGMAADSPPTQARNVVLVHGLFADGSCWSEMIARLQLAGLNVTAVQNPLTTLPEAVASNRRQRPASFSTAMKDVSPRKRSCATSRATCRRRRRRCSMRSRSRSIRLCSPARPRLGAVLPLEANSRLALSTLIKIESPPSGNVFCKSMAGGRRFFQDQATPRARRRPSCAKSEYMYSG